MLTIRDATRGDLPRIHAIRHDVTENRLSDPSTVTEGEVLWYMIEAIFLVSEGVSDGSPSVVQGFLCANHQTALIWGLFVDPLVQGRGHGSSLLTAALGRLKACGHLQA